MRRLADCLPICWLALACAAPPESPGTPTDLAPVPAAPVVGEWPRSDAQEEGLSVGALEALHTAIVGGEYGNIDRLVVVRNGHLVLSHEYPRDYREISRGHDDALGCGFETCDGDRASDPYNYYHPDLHPYYRGRPVHSLQSVTKSVAATLVGVALARGELESLEMPLLPFFDGYDLTTIDARLQDATVEDVLTMRTGIAWPAGPLDENYITLRLEHSDDWIQFVLSQPSDAAAGEAWHYNDGGSQLMSGILRRATGRHVYDYAEEHLFGPLGIRDFHWKKTPRGYGDTEGGLYLEAEDLARIGQLYLQDGVWEGERILAEGWVEAATTRHTARVRDEWGYGYQWWLLERRGVELWAGRGFGGQMLIILPDHDLVAVINAWNLFGADSQKIQEPFLDALIDAVGAAD